MRPGWERLAYGHFQFIVEAVLQDGVYCVVQDLLTHDGDTVENMPTVVRTIEKCARLQLGRIMDKERRRLLRAK